MENQENMKNMEKQFPLSPAAEKALQLLEESGFESYIVGGSVRDFCMHTPPHDFDITTASSPEETKKVFHACRVIPTGEKHGTVTVMMYGEPLEITTFRKDGDYLDGRHPEKVEFTSAIEEDLLRRDFTVNAMAYSPLRGMKDPFGGQSDLKRKLLRCVGDADRRFHEDALRLLRALRFAARLCFDIEESTHNALLNLAPLIEKVSRERVLSELNGLLLARDFERVMAVYRPVIECAVPEIRSIPQADYLSALRAMTRLDLDLSLRWAALLHPLGEEKAYQTLKNLKAPNRLCEDASRLAGHALSPITVQTAKVFMNRLGEDLAKQLSRLQGALNVIPDADAVRAEIDRVLESGECYTLANLAVTGNDLKAIGVTGRDIGKTLNLLLEKVMAGKLPNEKEALLRAIH